MSDPFFSLKDANLSYKSKVLAGILRRKAFVGPYFVAIGDRYHCNYRCIFCEWFSPLVRKPRSQVTSPDCMSLEDYKKVVEDLSALETKVLLIGNIEEPFLDTQLMQKIEFAKRHKLRCFLITNGALIDEKAAAQIVNMKLDYLNVSINAATPQTYPQVHTTANAETFSRIVSTVSLIGKLKEEKRTSKPRVRLSMVVCNRNYHDIPKFVDLCYKVGVKNAVIKKFISSTREIVEELELTPKQEEETRKHLSEAVELAKQRGVKLDMEWTQWTDRQKIPTDTNTPCYYGWLFSVIDADGNVYPCCFQNRTPSSAIGNIRTTDFKTLWSSEKYQDFRRNFKNIDRRRQMGYLCNQPSCFFNNKQVYDVLHKSYLLPITRST